MKIDKVKIKNFKSLKDINLNLKSLTLISGVNSSGKSSFIQSLLFFKENLEVILFTEQFRQYIGANSRVKLPQKTVSFNGKYIKLGEERSLLSQESSDNMMTFEISANQQAVNIAINQKLEIKYNKKSDFELLNIFNDNFFDYLNTDRTPPKLNFEFSQEDVNNNLIGINGEYAAHYLAENQSKNLEITGLQHPAAQTLQLLENTYKWLGEISSGVSISASADASRRSVKLTYQYEYGDNTTGNYSSLNVGFGLTYVLPVIVLILKSKPGDFIIIENPESHLHPAGQSKIAELCAIAAQNGVQIIVETHSDHFLNGLRVATKKGVIAPEKSQIYFFSKAKDSLDTIAHPINIGENGKLDDWPQGFFDEWDNQLDKLLW